MKNNYIDFDKKKSLFNYCRNVTNKDDDTFVGVKSEVIEGERKLSIHFPVGYEIPEDDKEVREDIIKLFSILQKYNDEQSMFPNKFNEKKLSKTIFPIHAYLLVIYTYLSRGYYQVNEDNYKKGLSGSINFGKTIKKEKVIPTKKGLVYLNYQVKKYSTSDKDLITEINKYCVYESYLKIGWIYKFPLPQKPKITKTVDIYRNHLFHCWHKTNIDNDKKLFKAMLDIIDFTNDIESPEEYYFGTNRFQFIWEKLVQATYGNIPKEEYFPKTKWLLRLGDKKENKPLQPDTIMKYKNNIYVLDSKYYKYGITQHPKDLPNSSSISKQIIYGRYIEENKKFKDDKKVEMNIYNAFLMPYNSKHKPYNLENDHYYSIGEAVSAHKYNKKNFERVQGILVDIRFLMKNQCHPNEKEIRLLSEKIIESLEKNNQE